MRDPTESPERWAQLLYAMLAMMAISSPQYVWTLFSGPFAKATGASATGVQVTFSILVVLQTWAAPAQGFPHRPVRPAPAGRPRAARCRASAGSSPAASTRCSASTRPTDCSAGLGTGFVYIGAIGLMARWFPDRRGFACGMVAAGYGFGALATTFPIDLDDQGGGVSRHAARLRAGPRRHRRRRRPVAARAGRRGGASRATGRRRAARDAAKPRVLADVPHDDDDVDGRPHGRVELQELRHRVRARRRHRCSASPRCRWRCPSTVSPTA